MSSLRNGDQKLVENSLSTVQSLVAAPSASLRRGHATKTEGAPWPDNGRQSNFQILPGVIPQEMGFDVQRHVGL